MVPRKDCTSFFVTGLTWFLIASTLWSGVDTMPLPTVCPRKVRDAYSHWHFAGLAVSPAFLSLSSTHLMCATWSSQVWLNMIMSSIYAPLKSWMSSRTVSIILWKDAGAFLNPKGIIVKWNFPYGVQKAVFS